MNSRQEDRAALNAAKGMEPRCDKCGTPQSRWDSTPCVMSLTQSPRHTVTRFFIPMPEVSRGE